MLSRYTSRYTTIQRRFNSYYKLSSCLFSTSSTTNQSSCISDKPFEKILIANRGEIAVRIMNTCKKMGISTVAIHSEADANSFFVHYADEAICVGPPPTNQSYLQIDRIVNAAKMTGAQAVHPGFGFLSENNNFAKALENENIVFIGPKSYAIEIMGDKIRSKEAALSAGTNCIPGDNRVICDVEECILISNEVGYPVMIKASAGGGGKGMRIAYNDGECRNAYIVAKNEAKSSFDDDRLFVEKFIEEPRHIEFQILCDKYGNYLHLNERECSIQRRNQKIYEEAPSVVVNNELRNKMATQAIGLAKAVDYISAGTVEFLVDKYSNFYFLEMNTRLQVEHPVTEYITGIDLVEEMINIASGKELHLTQNDIGINGWAIEARIYAEDAFNDFVPQTGTISNYRRPFPNNLSVRTDSGIQSAIVGVESKITPFYDPMIGKLIVHGNDRNEALSLMRDALDSYVIRGVNNNIPFLRTVLENERFICGNITTKFIEEEYSGGFGFKYINISDIEIESLVVTAAKVYYILRDLGDVCNGNLELNVGYKSNESGDVIDYNVCVQNENVFIVDEYSQYEIETDFNNYETDLFNVNINNCGNIIYQLIDYKIQTNGLVLQYKGLKYEFNIKLNNDVMFNGIEPDLNTICGEEIDAKKVLLSPVTGTIVSINVCVGQEVHCGMDAFITEAMKMQTICPITKDGIVKAIHVKEGDFVESKQKIIEIDLKKISKKVDIIYEMRDLNKNKMFENVSDIKNETNELGMIEIEDGINFDKLRDEIYVLKDIKNKIKSSKYLLLSYEKDGYKKPLTFNQNQNENEKFWNSDLKINVEILNEPLLQISNNAKFLNIYFAKIEGENKQCMFWPNHKPIQILYNEKEQKISYNKLNKFIAQKYDLNEELIVIISFKNNEKKEIILLNNNLKTISIDYDDILLVFDINKSQINGQSNDENKIKKYIEENIKSFTLPCYSTSIKKEY